MPLFCKVEVTTDHGLQALKAGVAGSPCPSDHCASVLPWCSCAQQPGDRRRRRQLRRLRRRWIRRLPRGRQWQLRRRSGLPRERRRRRRRELRLQQQKQQQIQQRQRWRRWRPERRLLPHSDRADLHPQLAQARGGVVATRLQYLSGSLFAKTSRALSPTFSQWVSASLQVTSTLGGEASQSYSLFISSKTHAHSGAPPLVPSWS